jgi:hypothetical protein
MTHAGRFGLLGVAITLVIALVACSQAADPATPVADVKSQSGSIFRGGKQERVPGEYLVMLSAGTDKQALTEVYDRYGIKEIRAMSNGVFLLRLSEDPGPETIEGRIQGDARFKAVQPNYVYRINRPGMKAD